MTAPIDMAPVRAPVLFRPTPWTGEVRHLEVPEGATLAQIVDRLEVGPGLRRHLIVTVDGQPVPAELWERARPRQGRTVHVRVALHGGGDDGNKNILRAVLMLAVVVVAAMASGPIGAAIAAQVGASASVTAGIIAATASVLTTAGMALVNALVPPPQQRRDFAFGDQGNPYAQLTGLRNQIAPYAPIPRIIGRRRVFPLLASRPYTETIGRDQFLRMLLLVGQGPLRITDIRIGETPLSAFVGVEVQTREGWANDPPQTLFSRVVQEDPFAVQLVGTDPGASYRWNVWDGWDTAWTDGGWTTTPPAETGIGWVQRTTRQFTTEISIDLTFPQGVAAFDDRGRPQNRDVQFEVEYRATGTTGAWLRPQWLVVNGQPPGMLGNGVIEVRGNATGTLVRSARWAVPSGQYDVRIRRITPPPTDRQVDASYWTALRSIREDNPVQHPGCALIALRLKANEQLQGVPDQISCLAESYLPVRQAGAWQWAVTRNPAWAFADLLRRRGQETRIADSRIDLAAISAWAAECEAQAPNAAEPRWTCDITLEGGSVVEALRMVASAGRAAYTMRDGLHSVVRDRPQTVPVQHITPRNSWGYEGARAWPDLPHALRIRFPNAARNYQPDERIVYADGYSEANATKFDTLDMPHVTTPEFAWREGRYFLAVLHGRPEKHTVNMDVDGLACSQGDLVMFAHDVVSIGLGSARIIGVATSGTFVTALECDEIFDLPTGQAYGVRVRTSKGSTWVSTIQPTGAVPSNVLTLVTPIVASELQIGDLVMVGPASLEAAPMIVERIRPADDLTVSLTLTAAAPGVHTADTGPIPAFETFMSGVQVGSLVPPAAPRLTLAAGGAEIERLADGTLIERLAIGVLPVPGLTAVVTGFEVQARRDDAQEWASLQSLPAQGGVVHVAADADQSWKVRARALSDAGPSAWAAQSITVTGKSAPPPAVTGLVATPRAGAIELSWAPSPDIDVIKYEVRQGATWASGTVLTTVAGTRFVVPRSDIASVTLWIVARDVLGQDGTPVSVTAAALPMPIGGANLLVDAQMLRGLTHRSTNWDNVPAVPTLLASVDPGVGVFVQVRTPTQAALAGGSFYGVALARTQTAADGVTVEGGARIGFRMGFSIAVASGSVPSVVDMAFVRFMGFRVTDGVWDTSIDVALPRVAGLQEFTHVFDAPATRRWVVVVRIRVAAGVATRAELNVWRPGLWRLPAGQTEVPPWSESVSADRLADQTAVNVAAAIAGQGDLATQNRAGLPLDVVPLLLNPEFARGLEGWGWYYAPPGNRALVMSGPRLVTDGGNVNEWLLGSIGQRAGAGTEDGAGFRGGRLLWRIKPGQKYAWRARGYAYGGCNAFAPFFRILNASATAELSGSGWGWNDAPAGFTAILFNNGSTAAQEAAGFWTAPSAAPADGWLEVEWYTLRDDRTGSGGVVLERLSLYEVRADWTGLVPYQIGEGSRIPRLSPGPTPLPDVIRLSDGVTPATDAALVTGQGTAAAIVGQGPLATASLTPAQVQGRFLGSFASEALAIAAGLQDGDNWFDTTAQQPRARQNGVTVIMGPLEASVSDRGVSGSRTTPGSVTTTTTTVSVANAIGAVTYAWALIGGPASTATSPTGATTAFTGQVSPDPIRATWECLITDSVGRTARVQVGAAFIQII